MKPISLDKQATELCIKSRNFLNSSFYFKMCPKVFLLLFLTLQVSGFSIFEFLYPKKSPQLSGSYISASVQITAHIIHQLAYKPNATKVNTTEVTHSVVIVEHDKDVVILNFTDQGSITTAKKSNPLKILKTMLVRLNKEAEKEDMDAYQKGFSDDLLAQLSETSPMTASSQLVFVLRNIDLAQVKPATKTSVDEVLRELANENSPLSKELEGLSPLIYLPV